jgi:hypothetical protein
MGGAAATAARMGPSEIVKHTVLGPLLIASSGGITSGIVGWFVESDATRQYLGYVILGSTAVWVGKTYLLDPLLRKLGVYPPVKKSSAANSIICSVAGVALDRLIPRTNLTRVHVPEITMDLIMENIRELANGDVPAGEMRVLGSSNTVDTYDFSRCKKATLMCGSKDPVVLVSSSLIEGQEIAISFSPIAGCAVI